MMNLFLFIYSFFYFVINIFQVKHYQIIFYSPSHFNRGNNFDNLFLKDFFRVCNKENISFLFLEEPYVYSHHKRSKQAVPFDFIYYLIIFLRKIMGSEMCQIESDKKIGRFLKNIFFRNFTFDNYITISQSMLSVFNGINPIVKSFDVQHGTIHAKKKSYLYDGIVSNNLLKNNVHVLLNGIGFKEILVKNDRSDFFLNNSHVAGASFNIKNDITRIPNKNVIVSLQFTHDHTYEQNAEIANLLENEIKANSSFHFFLRNHPRFNGEIDLSRFLALPNVSLISGSLEDCFLKCSIHLTYYSTVSFEAALSSIPTCFLKHLSFDFGDIFNSQYSYPYYDFNLSEIFDNYYLCSVNSKKWAAKFYQKFSKHTFLKSIKNG